MSIEVYRDLFYSYLNDYIQSNFQLEQSPYHCFNKLIQKDAYISIINDNAEDVSVSFHQPYHLQPNSEQLHDHNFFELVYRHRGICRNIFKNDRFEMKAGEILLLNPNCKHNIQAVGGEDDCIVNIKISERVFEKSMLSLMADNHLMLNFFANYIYRLGASTDYLYFSKITDQAIFRIIDSIVTEYFEKTAYTQTICQSFLIILLSRLSIAYAYQIGVSPENLDSVLIVDILSYMSDHCQTATAEDVARHFGYSTTHIWRIVKKHTGKGFGEVMQNIRFKKVKQYLETTSFSLETIAELMHYSDSSYLSKVFKQKYGLSPSDYQRHYKKTNTKLNE